MSEPPPILVPYPILYQKQLLPITSLGTTSAATSTTTSPNLREYRKGNWTLEETLILITAKRLDDERRVNTAGTPNSSRATGELRWKWVENYCWNNGCLRSQNQCNDKWDNLLRDYKKVREYELVRSSESSQPLSNSVPSYWAMDRTQRKDRNLPSNLILGIYEALNDVVQKKFPPPRPTLGQQPLTILPPPPPPPPLPSSVPPAAVAASEASDDSETNESGGGGGDEEGGSEVYMDTKRRRVRDIETSIMRSTSVLARTIKCNEEKRERRHREMMRLEEQRLQIEETRNEMNRQGLSGLIASVNGLSTAIHDLISDHRRA